MHLSSAASCERLLIFALGSSGLTRSGKKEGENQPSGSQQSKDSRRFPQTRETAQQHAWLAFVCPIELRGLAIVSHHCLLPLGSSDSSDEKRGGNQPSGSKQRLPQTPADVQDPKQHTYLACLCVPNERFGAPLHLSRVSLITSPTTFLCGERVR